MKPQKRFSESLTAKIEKSKILGIRAGDAHRFTGIWAVVVRGRVFVRSWNDKPLGWRKAILENPRGAISIDGKEYAVRAKSTRGEKLLAEIDAAYAEKYHTPASRKWVVGLNRGRRRMTTTELLPL